MKSAEIRSADRDFKAKVIDYMEGKLDQYGNSNGYGYSFVYETIQEKVGVTDKALNSLIPSIVSAYETKGLKVRFLRHDSNQVDTMHINS